ncbi:MAG: tetratricopeptide repeat protein [Candidatus Promineifilaceae bacterium]
MTENIIEPTTAEQEEQPNPPPEQQPFRIVRMAFSVFLFMTVWILFIVILPSVNRDLLTHALRAVIILIGGFLPAIIFGYFQSRRQILFIEYKQNLRRLGFIENAQIYRQKFDAIYGHSDMSRRDIVFQTPIIVSTILSVVGWIFVFYPPAQESLTLVPNATTLAYGFLGAYVFAIGSLVRQYVTDDLQQRYYASVVYRYLAVFVLAGLVTFIFPGNSSGGILTMAFTIGFFPSMGIRIVIRTATNIFNSVSLEKVEGFEDKDRLYLLQGPNAYHEDRLLLEGIDNIQNLACVDIVDLMLKTRFPVEQLVDWIDQALLYLHTGPRILPTIREKGIRTATDFIDLVDQGAPEKNGLLEGEDPLTLSHVNSIAVALRNDPNMFHVRYWRDHQFELLTEDVVLTRKANLKLMEGLPDEAIPLYDEAIRQFPNYHLGHFYRGLANAAAEKYGKAADDFRTALALAGPKWENASAARLQLGKSLQQMGQVEEATDAYRQAFTLDPAFTEAHLAYALLHLFLKEYPEAIEHFKIAVEKKFRTAESSANLGLAQLEQWKLLSGPSEEKDTLLDDARKNLEQAVKLKPELLPAYLNLATVYEELEETDKATQTYTNLLERPDSDSDQQVAYLARLRRGNLYFEEKDYRRAVIDYQDAVAISPSAIGYFNLGQAHARLNQSELALDAYHHAVSLNDSYMEAYQRLGELALQTNRFDEAIEAYTQELKLHEEGGNLAGQMFAHLNLGRSYRQSESHEQEALRELKQAADLAGRLADDLVFTSASYEMGLVYLSGRQFEEAAENFATSAELFDVLDQPYQSVEAGLLLARTLNAEGKTAEAKTALDTAETRLNGVAAPNQVEQTRLQNEISALRQTLN